MIDKKKASRKNTSLNSDFDVCDIDIDFDFELNNGKGAWVVVLQKNDHQQILPNDRIAKGRRDEFGG